MLIMFTKTRNTKTKSTTSIISCLICLLSLPLSLAQGTSPIPDSAQRYYSERVAFIESYFDSGWLWFEGQPSLRVYKPSAECHGPKLLVLPGWSEPAMTFSEFMQGLQNSYCVYSYDHRGQGFSGRMLSNSQIGHVQEFQDYLDDLHKVIQFVVQPRKGERLFLFGHSMGGLIALGYVAQHSRVDALVLSAPMLGINTSPWPHWLANLIVWSYTRLGGGENYTVGHSDWHPKPFADNPLTRDRDRYYYSELLFKRNPEVVIGGVSHQWLYASMAFIDKLPEQLSRLHIPVLLLQAGDEHFVEKDAHTMFCNAYSNCEIQVYPEARHQLLMEANPVRDQVYARINGFLNPLR